MLTAGRPNAASSHVSHSDSIQHPLTNRWAIAIGRLTLTIIVKDCGTLKNEY
ncbi:hypothetical protein T12_214 [Trichinella patagoniensis]|uniref:Uncharacterized protein n=1 Tax=Trichinella patagoniensis TaxID=990121 RepID=A0A0V0YVB2_9BILA|nr:hypothetical protein T12_214 [Trichinella patagoniensis]